MKFTAARFHAPAIALSWVVSWVHVALCSILNVYLMLTIHLDEVRGFWGTSLVRGAPLLALEHVASAGLMAYVVLEAVRTRSVGWSGRTQKWAGAGAALILLAANDLAFWEWGAAIERIQAMLSDELVQPVRIQSR